jgi:hypothetical protein
MKRLRLLNSALTILLMGWFSAAEAQPIPSAAAACYFVARVYLNPVNGLGQAIGYFTAIAGIGASDTLFYGSPGQSTAFFTFRSDVFSLAPLPSNGAFTLDLVNAGEFNIYYNPSPTGDWSDPNTFSGGKAFPGQPIATFARPESLVLNGVIGKHVVTGYLKSSRPFTFNGHSSDFNEIAPAGLTLNETASTVPDVPGISDFPVGLALAGNCLAVGNERQGDQ